jgi:hypothetical protein
MFALTVGLALFIELLVTTRSVRHRDDTAKATHQQREQDMVLLPKSEHRVFLPLPEWGRGGEIITPEYRL